MKKKLCLLLLAVAAFSRPHSMAQDEWTRSLGKISTIVPLIEEHHFKKADYRKMAYDSIKGIMLSLDPHSYFLDPSNLSTLREDYRGKYFGLGLLIQKHGDLLKVISPVEGGPAYRLGIQPNDIITHIEGESTKPITSYQAMQRLRGKKGSKVTITILREGMDPMDFTISREEIPLNSVRYAFILQDDIGYIFINNFAETTTREFRETMTRLRSEGMKRLILDFRGNPGGTFIQSLEISDEFLPKGALIVSIKGRKPYYNQEFNAELDNQYEDIPLIILVNHGTASAPEIVSGAVQDHDRGLIIGDDSWGKGLVQTVFPLAADAAVALTTARYYTPSGRSIQRDYTFWDDYRLGRNQTPEEKRDVFYTEGGRRVRGQGGITPDYKIENNYRNLTYYIRAQGMDFAYARSLTRMETPLGRELMKSGELGDDFRSDQRVLKDMQEYLDQNKVFQQFLERNRIEISAGDFEEAGEQILREVDREIHSQLRGIEAGWRIYQLEDPAVRKAVESFPEAVALRR